MLGRFTVRPLDDGSNRFGVWDGAVNGWRATDIDDETEAHRIASDLDVQYDAHGPRPADAIRKVNPTQAVQRAQWHNGELDVWIRDNGEWLGRVRDKNGRVTWIPGSDLRPL
ncbi:hypothetical protein E1218_11940 [Kribbella turkmenica]|uniref:Uncharacterized protein n=1 Tax=Kribbella turkmenica TaxID=2530375 RepID=A0A4R4X8U9_9ACTN|nr:hypothetical protein [Kribbella turkmenica]TDD26931.1 hypothetical protein E1218_11940 [Kribbella turkmenica]